MTDASTGEFSVYQFFPDETWERVASFVDARTAVITARQLTLSIGARITGTTRRVIIHRRPRFHVL